MRICFVGDSFVNGTGDDSCLGWVGRVCAAARTAGHDVTAYNLGIRRDTSGDVAARWQAETAPRLPPGCDGRIVFSFGANDCTVGDEAGDRPRVAPDLSRQNAERILTAARAGWPVLMIGPPPVGDPAADRRIRDLTGTYRLLCRCLGLPYLDVFPALAANAAWRDEAAAGDGAHPNAGGYAVLAALVAGWPAWRDWFEAR